MAQEKEIQSSYFLTEVNEDPYGKGEVDYLNVIQVGFLLPHFTLPDALGTEFSLKQEIGKHNLIVTFLHRAVCPCTKPFLKSLQEILPEIKAGQGKLIAISVDHPLILTNLLRELGLEFPLLYDAEQTAIRLYAVLDRDSVRREPHPTIFLADREGVIKHKDVSLTHADRLSLATLLERLKEL